MTGRVSEQNMERKEEEMAGFFGFFDFTKEGKGVDKNAPKKRGIFAFFELYFRKIGRLCKLNMLYILACIPTAAVVFFLSGVISTALLNMLAQPIATVLGLAAPDVTNAEYLKYSAMVDLIVRIVSCLMFTVLWGMGPVTAGYTYILRNYSREEHAWLWSDFWQYAKENFKQAIAVWLIDLAAMVVMFYAFMFYSTANSAVSALKYVIGVMIVIFTMMHFYIYPIMVTFRLSLKAIYQNSFLFALMKLPQNLLVLVILLAIHIGIPYAGISGLIPFGSTPIFWIVFVILELLLLISTSGFIVNFSVYPSLKKYMIMNAEPEIKSEQE